MSNDKLKAAIDRAIIMLDVAGKHCEQFATEALSNYDGTECDGVCIAGDCQEALSELNYQVTRIQESYQPMPVSLKECVEQAWNDLHADTILSDERRNEFVGRLNSTKSAWLDVAVRSVLRTIGVRHVD